MLLGSVGLTATVCSDSFRCRWLTSTFSGIETARDDVAPPPPAPARAAPTKTRTVAATVRIRRIGSSFLERKPSLNARRCQVLRSGLRVELPAGPEADLPVRPQSGLRKTLKRGDRNVRRVSVVRACGVEHGLDRRTCRVVGLLDPSGLCGIRRGRWEAVRLMPIVAPNPKRLRRVTS